jgi:hypothetical protein
LKRLWPAAIPAAVGILAAIAFQRVSWQTSASGPCDWAVWVALGFATAIAVYLTNPAPRREMDQLTKWLQAAMITAYGCVFVLGICAVLVGMALQNLSVFGLGVGIAMTLSVTAADLDRWNRAVKAALKEGSGKSKGGGRG